MSVTRLAENARTATQATIKRASAAARADMNALDARILDELIAIYQRAASDLHAAVLSYAGRDGTIRLEVLQSLLQQANERLQAMERARNELLSGALVQAAALGSAPLVTVSTSDSLTRISDDAVRFVRGFVAADGLQLSDRLWRLDQGAREAVARAIQSAVVQGYSASQAVNEFLMNGTTPPTELIDKSRAGNAVRIAGDVRAQLLTGEGNARDNALRVFRTELNRAHGEAYGVAALDAPDFAGFRYLLSPSHPRPDICDLHAHANLYGLGPGVYPDRQRLPWPAHPNTLSYFEIVFLDEISASDRAGVETRTQWLQRQNTQRQVDVLGQAKQRAFAAGHLSENEFTTPWRVVRARLAGQGIDIDPLESV